MALPSQFPEDQGGRAAFEAQAKEARPYIRSPQETFHFLSHFGCEFGCRENTDLRPGRLQARYTALGRTKMNLARPESGEYAPYYGKYIALVAGNDVTSALEAQQVQTMQLFAGRSERDGNFRYAADKWTVKDVLGHLSDSERIFAYRALRIARADQTPMSGFEQDDYVRSGGFKERKLASLVEEFADVRSATLALFRSLGSEAWLRRGTANKDEVSVRALAFIIAGHELHHRQILEERYFSAIPRA
jgi:DinB superfamily